MKGFDNISKKCNKILKICPNCSKEYYVYPSEENRMKFCSVACRREYNTIELKCQYCNKYFTVTPSQNNKKYCCADCRNRGMYEKSLETRVCRFCNNEFKIQKSSDILCCSDDCYNKWRNDHGYINCNCDNCNITFQILKSAYEAKNKHYCSKECSIEASKNGMFVKCSCCGIEIYRSKSALDKNINNFCSTECHKKYTAEINLNKLFCKHCSKEYKVKKSRLGVSKFCSQLCKQKWESENNIGENNKGYRRIECVCPNCSKKFLTKRYKLHISKKLFCCRDCSATYYSNPLNRTEKQKESDKKLAKNAINHVIPIFTKPHKLINEILNKNNIEFINEELIKYYKLDIYLPLNNLGIEINGDYWHTNPLRFKSIKYRQQLDKIYSDKSKHTYVKNKYNFEILYLWENDINNKKILCEKLILEYIKRNGKLENYHSFNYYIDKDDMLKLNQNLIIPYQEYKKEELNKHIEIYNYKSS